MKAQHSFPILSLRGLLRESFIFSGIMCEPGSNVLDVSEQGAQGGGSWRLEKSSYWGVSWFVLFTRCYDYLNSLAWDRQGM
jgi:hypothetical protein